MENYLIVFFGRFFDVIPPGTCSRLAIGLIVLVPVIAYNESGAITVLFSVFIASICATFSGKSILLFA